MRLRFVILVLFTISTICSTAQLRYAERYFEAVDTIKDVEYAQADFLNNPFGILAEYNVHEGENKTIVKSLYMDIFLPKDDTVSKRPAILFAHSGGFLIGSRHNDDMIAFCDSFAHRGYVTATMDYRLGMGSTISRFLGIPIRVSVDSINGSRSVYRSIQDSRAAIRFLKHHAEEYKIDTTKIFMVGSSAGGFVALHNLYLDKEKEIFKEALLPPGLGPIDTVGIQGYDGQADAIVSLWGALQTPKLIESENKGVLLVHGEDDEVVYFKKGMPLRKTIPDLEVLDFSVPETYGGYCIDSALTNRSIPHQTYFVKEKRHEFYGVDTGDWEENGPNEYWDTIHYKISNFLLGIFKPNAAFEINSDSPDLYFDNHSSTQHYAFWDFGDGNTSSELFPTHRYAGSGEYRVTLTACNENLACDTLSKIVNYIGLNANRIEKGSWKLYPNPTNGKLHVKGPAQKFQVEFFNLQGYKVYTWHSNNSDILHLNHLSDGTYLVRISTENTVLVRKFQKVQ